MNTLIERLREACKKLRRTPMPIADVIPMLQEAADTIEAMQRENEALRKDAELLDFVEEHPHLSLRKYKNRWSFVGLTNYEYSTFGTAREAIQATLDAGKY
jgi:hypothetical protein